MSEELQMCMFSFFCREPHCFTMETSNTLYLPLNSGFLGIQNPKWGCK